MWALQWQLNSASLLECIRRVGSSMTTEGMWGLPIPAQFQTALLWVFRRQRHLAVHFSLSSLRPPPCLYYSKVFHAFNTVFPLTKFFLLPQNHAQPGTWGKFSATLPYASCLKINLWAFSLQRHKGHPSSAQVFVHIWKRSVVKYDFVKSVVKHP